MITNINLSKIKELLKKGGLILSGSQTGYASIDRPWDKGKTEINIPNTNCYEALMNRSNFNASPILARCHEDELSIDRLKKESLEYAKSFQAMGIKKGDIVPLCIQTVNEGIIAFFALNRIGASATFLNATANKEEIENYIKKYDAKNIIISSKYCIITGDLVKDCNLNKALVISTKDSIVDSLNVSDLTKEYIKSSTKEFEETDNIISLKRFIELGKNQELVEYKPSKDDVALICYTSGSTGEPKAIVLTNENILAEIESLKKTIKMQLGPKGNSMQVVPFNYPYGFIISTLLPMYAGKTASLTPILTMSNLAEYLELYKPPFISGIPPLYKSFLDNEKINKMDLSFIKYAVSGGDTFDIASKNKINKFFKNHGSNAKVLDGSGNGEGCGCITNAILPFVKVNSTSVGKPIKGVDVKIINPETEEELKYNEVGKFCFSGKNVMKEYYNDEDNTHIVRKNIDGKIWFYTDTLAHIDKKGWMYIDGRERRFFITYDKTGSPYKVYCDFVQSVLNAIPGVKDSVVTQLHDDDRYYIPKAYLVLDEGIEYNEEFHHKIIDYCITKLQNCAIPLEYEIINEIKRTVADKVDYSYYEKLNEAAKETEKQKINKLN